MFNPGLVQNDSSMKTPLFAGFIVSALCGSSSLYAQTTYEPYSFSTFASAAVPPNPAPVGSANGPRNLARFNSPAGVAVDANGVVYVADTGNHTIRKIAGDVVSTLAGSPGLDGSANGTGGAARFFDPTGVAVDSAFNVYVADSGNHTIRKITPAGVVTTLAGAPGAAGSTNGTGGAARFKGPRAVAVDNAINVYVADTLNHTIRKIAPNGTVTTLAGLPSTSGSANGTGSAARFFHPQGVAVDNSFNVYVADTFNDTIRKITPSAAVSTLAGKAGVIGSSDGLAANARFFTPIGISVGISGALFVADADNQLIRKITAAGVVRTVGGVPGAVSSANGTGSAARFNSPQGVAVDGAGRVFVGDAGNNLIRLGQEPATAILANLSTRLLVQTGNNVGIGGFIIRGSVPKKVLIRGLGPSLTTVPNRMPDPRLELHRGAPTIAENDNWQTASNANEIPSLFRPSDPRESAILTTLQPGTYTVVMQPSGSTANGVGLLEIYDFDASAANAQLRNLSTRGFVEVGDNVMIGGFITSGGNGLTQVIVRAIGPSLTQAGIANALANPTLELRNGNGTLVILNDNWKETQRAAIQAAGLAPTNDLESAIFAKLPAGGYTAIVRGKNGTTGVALVEVYNLQ